MKKLTLAAVLLVAGLCGTWQLSRSRTWQIAGEIVPRVETDRKVVALTFDDGPSDLTVDEVLAPLARANVKATFFIIGSDGAKNRQAMARLVAAGHELGNHTYSHPRLLFVSSRRVLDEIHATDAVIRDAGYRGPVHLRAPYCKKLLAFPLYCRNSNRIHVTFDVEPESYGEVDRDTNKIVEHVVERVRPGSIILLHPWYRGRDRSRAAIAPIIERLEAQGYEFVTVDELLKLRKA